MEKSLRELSLQQKMVEIRSMIPALVKRAYSEDVSYDFTKIDDIFRYLTPAMNRYGVNLDIVAETATKKDDQGNSIYVQYLASNQLWLYEADLTMCWINADQPQDMDERTIHAIGTHETPEKAKGGAWTYALKYYFLNKFCIDQGGEDPDMNHYAATPEEGERNLENNLYEKGEKETNENDQEYLETENGAFTAIDSETEDIPFEPEQEYEKPAPEPKQTSSSERMMPGKPTGTRQKTDHAAIQKEKQNKERPRKEHSESSNSQIPPASRHIRPENGRPVVVPESAGIQVPDGSMTVEEACRIVCNCGMHRGVTLGELAQQGSEGIESLEWIAYDYRGNDEYLRQGARLLLGKALAA